MLVGFMDFSALKLVLRDERFPHSFLPDFVSLMQKFEVILQLDKDHLLIPSLLPVDADKSCVVLPFNVSIATDNLATIRDIEELNRLPYVKIGHLDMKLFARYYLLPYIPNGFFSRLLARIIGSKITECLSQCVSNETQESCVFDSLHWRCWRNGIVLVFRYMEIIRVSSTTLPYPDTDKVYVSSSKGKRLLECSGSKSKGIEILVAVLPETLVNQENEFFSSHDSISYSNYLAVWILRQLTETIDSVFDDWYESFSRRKGFDLRIVEQVSPCPLCLSRALNAESKSKRKSYPQDVSKSLDMSSSGYVSYIELNKQWRNFHLFTSPYCVLAASKGWYLECVDHNLISVSCIAPDLVSANYIIVASYYCFFGAGILRFPIFNVVL